MTQPNHRDDPVDHLIECGRVVCPRNGWDEPGSIAIRGNRIAWVQLASDDVSRRAVPSRRHSISLPNGILLPGLIDLHAHPAIEGTDSLGIDPDLGMLSCGVTTVMSQGDAGAENIDAYIEQTIRRAQARVILAVHVSQVGERSDGSCRRLDDVDVDACIRAFKRHPDSIWGIAVNASHHSCRETDPRQVVARGLEVADHTGLPILFGMRRPEDWPLEEQLALLRPGDIVTYCYRRTPHCIVDMNTKRVLSAVVEARNRGVQFDVGHGRASFDFEVTEAAIADGFMPDTISTDLQRGHLELNQERPYATMEQSYLDLNRRHSLPLVMAKLEAAGMPEDDVFEAVTSRPAGILRQFPEIGSLTPGSVADLVVLRRTSSDQTLIDATEVRRRSTGWHVDLVVRDGIICHEAS